MGGDSRRIRWPWVGHGAGLTTAVYTLPEPAAGPGPGRAPGQPFPGGAGRRFLPRARLCQGEGRRLAALVLGPPGQFPELIPEEHAEDGVGTQAQVGGAQTLVECQGALLPPDLHQAVGEAAIQLALGTDTGQTSLQVSWGPGWHNGVCLCVWASVAHQKGHSAKLGKSHNSNPSGCES